VIDVSGDGADNAGTDPRAARRLAERLGVQINGLAIEGMGLAITNFYRAQVITRDGFVMTARGHSTYAETLRRKILREVSRALL
jgi:Ca-activated chloride channel family protein